MNIMAMLKLKKYWSLPFSQSAFVRHLNRGTIIVYASVQMVTASQLMTAVSLSIYNYTEAHRNIRREDWTNEFMKSGRAVPT